MLSARDACLTLRDCISAGVAREEDSKFSNNKDLDFESAQSVSDHLLRGTDQSWADTFATNSRAVFFASAAFLPLLEEGHKTIRGYTSSIVNITSISGIMRGPSKAGSDIDYYNY